MEQGIVKALIETEMKKSYLDYSMSVIVGRALPDVRDGLKPVHRRILYAMHKEGLHYNKKFSKCAGVVGSVLKYFHPHGDSSVYDALVRLAQEWSLRYPLVNGQGNFGCFTKDTKVALTDGRKISFEELIKESKEGKKNFTYTINKYNEIEIAEIKKPRLTKKDQKILKITLDNDEEIKCTLNHKFMLRDGTYKEAQELKAGESLMPLYIRQSNEKDSLKPKLKGYDLVHHPGPETWEPVHILADKWNLDGRVYEKTRVNYNTRRGAGIIKFNKGLERFFYGNKDQLTKKLNHKIKEISFLNKKESVYDLTIDNTHNFALGAGVFVHNSVDGDPPAAYRYTEAKLQKLTNELLKDIEKETIDFTANFDETTEEPIILPALLPNLLINGSTGIAVGMATNIPPHNLKEVVEAIEAYLKNPEITTSHLMNYIKGPDFPTGGIILGSSGIKQAYETGKGKIRVRAKIDIEEGKKKKIVITEIPYQVNKAALVEQIADLVKEKVVANITDIRDESDRKGMRIVIELKEGANEQLVINKILKHSNLETTFGIMNVALVNNEPRVLTLKEIIEEYIKHRREVITRRTRFDVKKAKEREHILEGLKVALENIDPIIALIKKSNNTQKAKERLQEEYQLTEIQAQAILEMRLQKLTTLEQENVINELKQLKETIQDLEDILAKPERVTTIIKEDLESLKQEYGDERRTKIEEGLDEGIEDEDLIKQEQVVITLSHAGYIKRLPTETYKAQKRGGKGIIGSTTKEEDFIENVFVTNTHEYILFFTSKGKVHWLKGYAIPEAGRYAKGTAIVNLLPLEKEETIAATIPINKFEGYLVMATKKGVIKKTSLEEYARPRQGGIIGITLREDDELINVRKTEGAQQIMIATKDGRAVRFEEKDISTVGRASIGVRGIKVKNSEVISMDTSSNEKNFVLTVTEKGYGKRTEIKEYRLINRGGSGVTNIKTTEKNGKVVSVRIVEETDDLILVTKQGMTIRTAVKDISVIGRATQGVRMIRLHEGDTLKSVAIVPKEEMEEKKLESNISKN